MYSTVCETAVEYDNAGNLIKDHRGCRYVYDYENKITRIFIDENANGVHDAGVDANIVEFTYDALGWRIERTNPSGTALRYYYDDQRVVLRTNVDSGGVESDSRSFVFGNYIDEVLMMCPLGLEFYYAHDHLYSPAVLFNSSGGIDERYEYDAYGKRSMYSGTWAPRTSSPMGNFYAFTGRELDYLDGGNLQIMYYRARYFDPETGRFMQRDPLGHMIGLNLYEYVDSCPINSIDPSGKVHFRPPATPFKCALICEILDFASSSSRVNNELWEYYKSGEGGVKEMSPDDFDQGGADRAAFQQRYNDNAHYDMMRWAQSLQCNQTTTTNETFGWLVYTADGGLIGGSQMINKYKLKARIQIELTKHCKNNCCLGLEVKVTYNFWFRDRTDFNNGENFNVPGIGTIDDQLVNECNLGKPFQIYASSTATDTWTAPCDAYR